MEAETGPVTRTLRVAEAKTPFALETEGQPEILSVDPNYHLFRRLVPSEIPPSIHSLKSAPSVLVVLTEDAPSGIKEAATHMVSSLGLKNVQWVPEIHLKPEDIAQNHLLVVGRPRTQILLPELKQGLSMGQSGFVLYGRADNQPQDALLAVYRHPADPQRTCRSVLAPLGQRCPAGGRQDHPLRQVQLPGISKRRECGKGHMGCFRVPLDLCLEREMRTTSQRSRAR